MPSFGELVNYFSEEYKNRILEFIFLKSEKVLNLTQYSSEKSNTIDFSCKLSEKLCSRIQNLDYPLTRLTNRVFFNQKKWFLFQGVFSPRIESELLVRILKDWVKELNLYSFSYIDLCSGSGVIFLSVLEELNSYIKRGVAIDSSFRACKNISKNSELSKDNSKIEIYLTDWVKYLTKNSEWDVITINPPYLSEKELKESKEFCLGDPKWALQGALQGWSHYQKMLEFAKTNSYWKLIIFECSEFHEQLWDRDNSLFTIRKYRDYLDKFRAIALIRK
ncbi:N5-glutamine methyltransferase family protein [Mycoplasma suis]|uniref:Uncharacterized protein n=1 Tax=Mycoplasma suis (strain Illinois) TaxID=768700 RepID=F0QSA8_MYCSL|nr:class I SAM-dependent methyltransferase [Mycoplasma suis]ADX98378.1 conserved hypothetical protein [Mycoplasma suis str. Illinois]